MTDILNETQFAPERKAGRRGLIRESHEPTLMLGQFKVETGIAPEVPTSWDGTHGITNNGMDGNDRLGDCGAAAVDHYNVYAANDTALIGTLGKPTYSGVEATYFAYGIAQGEPGPEPDQGVDNATWLAFLYKEGIIQGYAEVPLSEVRQYAAKFGGVLVGQSLPATAEQDFEATPPVPWGSNGEVPDQQEGHDTLFIKYDPSGGEMATWSGLQPVSNEYLDPASGFLGDAWVLFDKETLEVAGYDSAAVYAALEALHGVVTPPPAPEPVPSPSVPPIPVPEADGFLDKVKELADAAVADLEKEIERVSAEAEAEVGRLKGEIEKILGAAGSAASSLSE